MCNPDPSSATAAECRRVCTPDWPVSAPSWPRTPSRAAHCAGERAIHPKGRSRRWCLVPSIVFGPAMRESSGPQSAPGRCRRVGRPGHLSAIGRHLAGPILNRPQSIAPETMQTGNAVDRNRKLYRLPTPENHRAATQPKTITRTPLAETNAVRATKIYAIGRRRRALPVSLDGTIG